LSGAPKELRVGSETFLARTVRLNPSIAPFVHLTVLKSYDEAAAFLDRLNRLLIALGILSTIAGGGLVFLLSHTFTKPLANLVAGVRALGKGDFAYPLNSSSTDEIAEVTDAFDRMRHNFQTMQHELLRAEQLATIGQMAAFVSHDLRHPLTAVLANAEFLAESDLTDEQREELYCEIRMAVDRMTDLIESLLEFSHSRESLQSETHCVLEVVEYAIHAVQSRPEFQRIEISTTSDGECEALFDRGKVERALVNLLLNACQSVLPEAGMIRVNIHELSDAVEICVEDNGPGVAENIRERLFQPFVSHGKQNGIGLGLTITKKILQDHGGDVCLLTTEPGKTIFRLILPKEVHSESVHSRVLAIENVRHSGHLAEELSAGDGATRDGQHIS
jgi:signal transduction histidine kinase